jgi:hypothetical protein
MPTPDSGAFMSSGSGSRPADADTRAFANATEVPHLKIRPGDRLKAQIHEMRDVSMPNTDKHSYNARVTFLCNGQKSSRLFVQCGIAAGRITEEGRYGNKFVKLALPKDVAHAICGAIGDKVGLGENVAGSETENYTFFSVNIPESASSNFGVPDRGVLRKMHVSDMLNKAGKGLGGFGELEIRIKCQTSTRLVSIGAGSWNIGMEVCGFALMTLIDDLVAPHTYTPTSAFSSEVASMVVDPETAALFGTHAQPSQF